MAGVGVMEARPGSREPMMGVVLGGMGSVGLRKVAGASMGGILVANGWVECRICASCSTFSVTGFLVVAAGGMKLAG